MCVGPGREVRRHRLCNATRRLCQAGGGVKSSSNRRLAAGLFPQVSLRILKAAAFYYIYIIPYHTLYYSVRYTIYIPLESPSWENAYGLLLRHRP